MGRSSLNKGITHKHIKCFMRSKYGDFLPVFMFQCLQHVSTLVLRSNDSFSCRCFPDLLARSIHFPLNHLTVGFFSSDSAFTLATNVIFSPAQRNSLLSGLTRYTSDSENAALTFCYFVQSVIKFYKKYLYIHTFNVVDVQYVSVYLR